RGDHEIVRLAAYTVELLQGDAAIRIGFTREVERPLESRVVFEGARLARERRRWICRSQILERRACSVPSALADQPSAALEQPAARRGGRGLQLRDPSPERFLVRVQISHSRRPPHGG